MSNEELTERVRGIIATAQHVPVENITADSTFEQLGIDSLDGINILFKFFEHQRSRSPSALDEAGQAQGIKKSLH